MLPDVIDTFNNLLVTINNISKERRELKYRALKAVLKALDETSLYFRDLESGNLHDLDREAMLVHYWSAAAIIIRHCDPHFAEICYSKSQYWVNPLNYTQEQIDESGISLVNVRSRYRKKLYPWYKSSKKIIRIK